MTVISLSIEESEEEFISAVPKYIDISTNIPATIFYTLDGTTPTTSSSVYLSRLFLPSDQTPLILSVFASNGIDTSSIFSKTYTTNILHNTRLPHAEVIPVNNSANEDLFPFGSPPVQPNSIFGNNANTGTTIDKPDVPNFNQGFDADGNPAVPSDSTNPNVDYEVIFSDRNSKGETPKGVGNLPPITIIGKSSPVEYTQEESKQSDKLFNPKAMVIFQDASKDDPNEPIHINRQFFSLENSEIISDGNNFSTAGGDTPLISGSFLRSHYNPRTQEITYYYRDSVVNRWIISKMPYQPKSDDPGNLSGMVFGRENNTAGFVFKWIYGKYRTLF